MNARQLYPSLCLAAFGLVSALPALGLANRVFVSARSGNNANSCDNILTPCQTLAGAVLQLNPGGEAIVLDSGGYGPVTITKALTIEAPLGVTAFIHPPSGDAITVNAGATDVVTLRGLVLNGGTGNGITLINVGSLNVVNCVIAGFANGIATVGNTPVRLNLKGTDITACGTGVYYANLNGYVGAAIDHCHLDGNGTGFFAATTAPAASSTSATNSTANNNTGDGWICGGETTGYDFLQLEFCTASGNGADGQYANGPNVGVTLSNCQLIGNVHLDVEMGLGTIYTRGNNTFASTSGGLFPFTAK